eukprot:m.17985 g.17985  ORF g.17985 m.17985 type:complete len:164 (-) comp11770_c0_seq1:396-887(-)
MAIMQGKGKTLALLPLLVLCQGTIVDARVVRERRADSTSTSFSSSTSSSTSSSFQRALSSSSTATSSSSSSSSTSTNPSSTSSSSSSSSSSTSTPNYDDYIKFTSSDDKQMKSEHVIAIVAVILVIAIIGVAVGVIMYHKRQPSEHQRLGYPMQTESTISDDN